MSKIGVDRDSVKNLSEKAAQEPTRFNATERSEHIRSTVKQIREMADKRHSLEDIKSVFPEFAEQYPGLFSMILRPEGFDERSLGLMIRMLNTMGEGKASQHEASIKVGQHLLNAYVKPQLDSQHN